MDEEKELLRGKISGIFYHPSLLLTNKRLIIGDRSINFNEMLKVYSKKENIESKMVICLKNGKNEELSIAPEKNVLATASLSGNMNAQENEMRTRSEATTDKWVNLLNECLSSIKETKKHPQILSQEPPVQHPEAVSQKNLEDNERIEKYFKNFSRPFSEAISQKNFEASDIAKRLRILKNLLEDNLITEEDFEKRKKEILSEI